MEQTGLDMVTLEHPPAGCEDVCIQRSLQHTAPSGGHAGCNQRFFCCPVTAPLDCMSQPRGLDGILQLALSGCKGSSAAARRGGGSCYPRADAGFLLTHRHAGASYIFSHTQPLCLCDVRAFSRSSHRCVTGLSQVCLHRCVLAQLKCRWCPPPAPLTACQRRGRMHLGSCSTPKQCPAELAQHPPPCPGYGTVPSSPTPHQCTLDVCVFVYLRNSLYHRSATARCTRPVGTRRTNRRCIW